MIESVAHMLDRSLRKAGHTRRFVIRPTTPLGWEVSEEADNQTVSTVRYTDWHRVERARTMIGLKVSDLAQNGWVEVSQAAC
jgi:hypothetical protein